MTRSRSGSFVLYALLITGAAVFSFPFLWMASSSVKVDREVYAEDLTIKPLTPSATVRSPWIDHDYYAKLPGTVARQSDVLPALQKIVAAKLQDVKGYDRDDLAAQAARGVYQRLGRMVPAATWTGPADGLVAAATPLVDAEMIGTVAHNVARKLSVGPLKLGLDDDTEVEPMAGTPVAGRWTNRSPGVATLVDDNDGRRAAADVSYDFSHGDAFTLVSDVALPTTADHVAKLRLGLHPDDSWHTMTLTVETAGRKWQGSRATPLANFDWQTLAWQWPSDEDASLAVHNWVTLKDVGGSDVTDAKTMRVTLAVQQASPVRAWWNKVRFNYDRVGDSIPFFRYLRVSIFLVAANVVLTLFTSSFVAYAFARLQWPGRGAAFVLMLATLMIPGQVLMIPHFLIWKSVGAFDTLTPLWLPALFGNAFYIFMLYQFIRGIPPDLEEAARIDGCNFLGIYWNVILPLIKPSLAAIAIFTFMASWNDFFGPLLYVSDQRLYPLSFGLYALAVEVSNSPTITMAAGVLMTIPVVIIFFAAQRYFVQGITLTGMKG